MILAPFSSLPEGNLRLPDGAPAGGAKAFVLERASEKPIVVYRDEIGASEHRQPLTADSDGRLPGFLLVQPMHVSWRSADGNVQVGRPVRASSRRFETVPDAAVASWHPPLTFARMKFADLIPPPPPPTIPFTEIDIIDANGALVATVTAPTGAFSLCDEPETGDALVGASGDWGITAAGVPYFDTAGASPGERAQLTFDPSIQSLVLVSAGGGTLAPPPPPALTLPVIYDAGSPPVPPPPPPALTLPVIS